MSNKPEANEMAKQIIESICGGNLDTKNNKKNSNTKSDLEVGKIYEGKVVKITDFGAFVDLPGNVDGFLHISQLANHRVEFVDDVLQIGDVIKVKMIGFDKSNKPKLTYKNIDQKTGEEK